MSDQQEATEDATSKYDRLTDREREIAIGLASRTRSRDIADKLGISIKTVDSHRQNILKKLEVDGNPELVHDAIANGVIPVAGEHLPSLLELARVARELTGGAPIEDALGRLRGAVEKLDSHRQG